MSPYQKSIAYNRSIVVMGGVSKRGENRRENFGYKNQRQKPIHKKYKANESTSRHNPKEKRNQRINKQ